MKKPWSITTTLRNPERLRDFLIVFQQIEGQNWNSENQKKFQILLIKERVYGYGSTQFYSGLTQKQKTLLDDKNKIIPFATAKKIFNMKNYEDPAMRGRQSLNPLKKFGFVVLKNDKMHITSLGKLFLNEDFDLGEIFFRSFIKWQLPNPDSTDYKLKDDYNIKPFIGILHLINEVNKKTIKNGEKSKGISKHEFSLFGPTLVNFLDIDKYADKIVALRQEQKGKNKQEQQIIFEKHQRIFAQEFLNTSNQKDIDKLLKNLNDYADNAIRYFRLTRFLYVRGGGFYIDLELRRKIEIDNLLSFDNAKMHEFDTKEQYLNYIADITKPKLPWETKSEYIKIIANLVDEIKKYEKKLHVSTKKIKKYHNFADKDLKNYILDLRNHRRLLQNEENHQKSQDIEQIKSYISDLENIYNFDNKPTLLEKLSTLGLNALNDAIEIKPNYPVGDDNEPTFTAPANVPDIECYYETFTAICEVTMLKGRDQWYNEGQPVMRHFRDFEKQNRSKKSYCLFVAPGIHRDTLNTFWSSIKYEYEGKKQNIIPLTIKQFIQLLKILIEVKKKGGKLTHIEISMLYDTILKMVANHSDSTAWLADIPNVIGCWEKFLLLNHK